MQKSVTLLAALAAITTTLFAQQANQTPQIYVSATSYHVDDANRAAYEKWLKERFKPFAQALLKEVPRLTAVQATRVIYGGVEEPRANAYVAYVGEGVPSPITEAQDKVAKQLYSKSYADFIAEARPLRTRLGQTLSRRVASTTPATAEGDITRLDFKKVTAGRMQEYLQLERDYEKLRAAQVEAGRMTYWGSWALVLPGGTERDFDAYTIHSGKTLEQVLNWGRNQSEIAAKMNPPFGLVGPAMRGSELQKIVRSEARVVVLMVRR